MRVVLEDYGHYATGRKPREGEDALLVLDEFSRPRLRAWTSAINLAERVRDVGVQVVVAAQSVEGLGDHRQAPRLLASCAGGIVVHQCPDPERLLALAGMVRTLEHNWELDYYGPRGFAKARMGERPRIDPEAVRQAQPGEAWVIQAGQSIHLRVLPTAGRGAGAGRAGGHPAAGRRHHAAARSRSRPRSGSPPPSPSPGGASAGPGSASAGGGSGPGGCPPRPGGRGWSGGPCPVGGGDEGTGGDRPRLRRRVAGTLHPDADRPVACWTGCHLAAARVKGAAVLAALLLASLRDRLRRPLTRPSSRRPGETRSPGAGEEQRPTSRQGGEDRGGPS